MGREKGTPRPPKPPGAESNSRSARNQPSKQDKSAALRALMHDVPEGTEISHLVFAFLTPASKGARPPDPHEDRHAAIVGAAAVEHGLKRAIALHLAPDADIKDVFGNYPASPLSSFSHRATMARALGVITDETVADLAIIRAIRNTFAHSVQPISFENHELAALAGDLKILRTDTWSLMDQLYPGARDRYVISCAIHLTALDAYKPRARERSHAELIADALLAWPGTPLPQSTQRGILGGLSFGSSEPPPEASQG